MPLGAGACECSDSDTAGRRACSLAHHTALQVIWRRGLDESCGLIAAFPGQLRARIPLKHSHTRLLPASARHTLAPTQLSPQLWNEALRLASDHGRCHWPRLLPPAHAVWAHRRVSSERPQTLSPQHPRYAPPALATQLWSRPPHSRTRTRGAGCSLFSRAPLAAAQAGGCWLLHIASRPSSLPPSLPHPWCRRAIEPPAAQAPFERARAQESLPSSSTRPLRPSRARRPPAPQSFGDCSAWANAAPVSQRADRPASRPATGALQVPRPHTRTHTPSALCRPPGAQSHKQRTRKSSVAADSHGAWQARCIIARARSSRSLRLCGTSQTPSANLASLDQPTPTSQRPRPAHRRLPILAAPELQGPWVQQGWQQRDRYLDAPGSCSAPQIRLHRVVASQLPSRFPPPTPLLVASNATPARAARSTKLTTLVRSRASTAHVRTLL